LRCQAREVQTAKSETDARRLWLVRKSIGGLMGSMDRLEPILFDLHKLACDLGGTLTGEHGIGMTKAEYMSLEHDPVALKLMRTLKKALDPNNILNPGKMGLLSLNPASTIGYGLNRSVFKALYTQ